MSALISRPSPDMKDDDIRARRPLDLGARRASRAPRSLKGRKNRRGKTMRIQFAVAAFAACLFAGGAQAAPAAYHVTKTITLGAPDRWDYVVLDKEGGRVFVAHGDKVSVVNAKTGARIGDVE